MNVFKDIDIAEPIWKTKSVGLNLDDVPIGQNVRVTISYVKKTDGKIAFPGEYIIEADKVRLSYPAQVIRGSMKVYIVPISDLAKLTVFNNSKTPIKMLFGSNELSKIIKESEEAKAGNFENKKQLTPGKHIMTLKEISLQHAKSDNNPMIVAEFELDEDHRTIKDYMKIAGPNTDIPRQKLVKLFHRGFGYEIQPCQDEAALMNQLTKFQGKKVSVALKGQKKAYCFTDKDGKDIVMEQVFAEFWYAGSMAEFDDFHIDESKMITELSTEDKEKLVRFAQINKGPYIPKSSSATEAPKAPELIAPEEPKREPVKVEEVPAKVEEPQAEAPVQTAQETPKSPEAPAEEAEGDDDFPF